MTLFLTEIFEEFDNAKQYFALCCAEGDLAVCDYSTGCNASTDVCMGGC